MQDRYTSGEYLVANRTWHVEDSPWKADQILRMINKNALQPRSVAEIGCGAGHIIAKLSEDPGLAGADFSGYDISTQAIKMCSELQAERVEYKCENIIAKENTDHFDILLVIDVFEHVPDYLGFLQKCQRKAEYKIYHIPLEIHVSSVLRNIMARGRESLGHLHYFTFDSAIDSLKDTGHEIVDYFYTDAAFGLFHQHPSFKRALANCPRWVFSKFSLPFTVRVFGGYSLMVLTK